MIFLTNCFLLFFRLILFLIKPFMFNFPENERKCVSPPKDDLLRMSATKLSQLIRRRKVLCEEVIKVYIKAIREVNPIVNAVVQDRFEDALKEAKYVDEYLKTTPLTENELQRIKPLLGIPLTIKESCMLSGMSYAVGNVPREGIKADKDGEAVTRLKISGAIPLLVSTTPELCSSLYCQNNITGITCCPYDVTRNSGASSGGEAALLGSGASLIGIGSDLLGSIRFPAMCCGVFGHKPTPRIIPIKGHMPLPSDERIYDYLVIGPLTRHAEDLKLLMIILCGKQGSELDLRKQVDLSKLRVYYMEGPPASFLYGSAATEIKEAISESVKFLEQTCHTKTIRDNSNIAECFRNSLHMILSLVLQMEGLPNLKSENRNATVELIKSAFGYSKYSFGFLLTVALLDYKSLVVNEQYNELREVLKKKLTEQLGEDGILLFPTFNSGAVHHREGLLKYGEALCYLGIFNILGLPTTQVPCGRSSNGLPIGLQVVAAPNKDRLCFAVAEKLEKCFGGWIPPNSPKEVPSSNSK